MGTGYAIFVLGDSSSEARQNLASQASEVRREVLKTALSKRLRGARELSTQDVNGNGRATPISTVAGAQQRRAPGRWRPPDDQQLAVNPTPLSVSESEACGNRFYVVTGPDANLTSLAADRLISALFRTKSDEATINTTAAAVSSPHGRLVVPYDCVLGTGRFSLLLEQQLLRPQESPQAAACLAEEQKYYVESDSEQRPYSDSLQDDSQHRQQEPQEQEQEQQQHRRQKQLLEPWNTAPDISGGNQDSMLPESASSTAKTPSPQRHSQLVEVSTWESLVLRATRLMINPEELDQGALWALEHALSAMTDDDDDEDGGDNKYHNFFPPGEDEEEEKEEEVLSSSADASQQQSSFAAESEDIANTHDGTVSNDGHLRKQEEHNRWPDSQSSSSSGNDDDFDEEFFSDSAKVAAGMEPAMGSKARKKIKNGEHIVEVEDFTSEGKTAPCSRDVLKPESGSESDTEEVSARNLTSMHGKGNFVLELRWPERGDAGEQVAGERPADGEGEETLVLCGDLARWGWRLAASGLGRVVVRSVGGARRTVSSFIVNYILGMFFL